MNENEDLDLLALQRQLDDAFETTRPRPAFEDELWLRIQARRPIWVRLRDGFGSLIAGIREAPAVPSAAVAIVLIVLVGAGIFTLSGLRPGGSTSSATTGLSQEGPAAAQPNRSAQFGPLPAPRLAVPSPATTTPPGGPLYSQSGSANRIYLGPATLTWAGRLDVTAASLPVFRYQEPTPAAANTFAASVGASPTPQVAPGGLGMYSGKDFTLVVVGSVAQPPHEPSFQVSELKSAAGAAGDPVVVATAYLATRNLVPTWTYQVDIQSIGTTLRVRFLRSFDLQAQGQASLVDSVGERYGTEVDTTTNSPGAYETGPLPLHLDSATYPIISGDQAVRSALASSASTGAANPYPRVQLTKAELVYVLVWAGDHSFYEPAFLFSGTFTDHGSSYVRRVLVPAVDPSQLSP